jgi:hypothetical protein
MFETLYEVFRKCQRKSSYFDEKSVRKNRPVLHFVIEPFSSGCYHSLVESGNPRGTIQAKRRTSMRRPALLLAGLVLAAATLPAQAPLRAPDGGTSYHVDGVDLLPLPGMPLSGKSSIEWTRTLEDGSTVIVSGLSNLARDSAGRMYRERRSFVPANSNQQNRLNEIMIFDPVARTQTHCTVATRQCVVSNYRPRTQVNLQPVGSFANGTRYLTREEVGQDSIGGIDVQGTRETTTINAGSVGNDRPLATTREFWYAASIHTNVLVTRTDPREGKQVIRLTDLSLSEPDPHTFDIPEGYTVADQRLPERIER